MLVITERKTTIGKTFLSREIEGGTEGDGSFTNIPGTRGNLKVTETALLRSRRPRAAARFDDGEPSSKGQDGRLTMERRARGSGARLGKMRVGETSGDVVKEKTKKKQRGREGK